MQNIRFAVPNSLIVRVPPSFIKEHCISEWQRVGLGLGRAREQCTGGTRKGEGERRQPAAPSCAPSSSSGPSLRPSVRLCCEIGSSGFVFPRLRSAAAATAAAEEEDYSTATHYAAEFVCLSGDRLRDLWRNIPRQYHVRLA